MKTITLFSLLVLNSLFTAYSQESIYDFTVLDIEGNEVSLSEYRGKVLLIVNVASKCGFTPQYEGLEELYQKYAEQGLVILGFPANDFLRQEPGDDQQIQSFCSINYGVTFPMFSKISVTGRNKAPLYSFLVEKETNPDFSGRIKWNFSKFLIDGEGQIVNRFAPSTEPLSEEIVSSIEALLNP